MPEPFELSDTATVTCQFAVSGVDTDPTTVSLTVVKPSGSTATYTYASAQITREGTGSFSKDLACDERGVWFYRWVGTGSCAAADEGTFQVNL